MTPGWHITVAVAATLGALVAATPADAQDVGDRGKGWVKGTAYLPAKAKVAEKIVVPPVTRTPAPVVAMPAARPPAMPPASEPPLPLPPAQPRSATSGAPLVFGGVTAAVWHPTIKTAPLPLVIFSHDIGGCNTHYAYLMRALATDTIAMAVAHRDANCASTRAGMGSAPQRPYAVPDTWSDTTHKERAIDFKRLVTGIAADAAWKDRVDWTRVVLAGHSLGGYTALGVAGGWPGWRIDGIEVKAVLTLAPYTEPFVVKGMLRSVTAPIMFQGGTRDLGVTPVIKRPRGAFAQSGGKAAFVEIAGASHLAWTDSTPEHHGTIVHYARAFIATHVHGKTTTLAAAPRGTAEIREK